MHNPMQSANRADPQRLKCGAKNKQGAKHSTCQDWALPGKKRCRRHGGLTPSGPDSPHWKTGERAGARTGIKPPELKALYEASVGDPQLMQFRHDAALLEAIRRQITTRLGDDRVLSKAQRDAILDVTDGLRKVKEAEQRRLQVLMNSVPLEQHRRAMAMTASIVYEVLTERLGQALDLLPADSPARALLVAGDITREMGTRYRVAALRIPSIMDMTDQAIEGKALDAVSS